MAVVDMVSSVAYAIPYSCKGGRVKKEEAKQSGTQVRGQKQRGSASQSHVTVPGKALQSLGAEQDFGTHIS